MKCPKCKSKDADFQRRGLGLVTETGYFNKEGNWVCNDSEHESMLYYEDTLICTECNGKINIGELIMKKHRTKTN